MRFHDFYKILYKELRKKDFNITLTGVKKQLLQHPFYPCMQSVTDYLTDMDIPNTVVRIDFEQLQQAITEADVIVLVKDDEGDNLLWIKEINENSLIYSNDKPDSKDAFLTKWQGVALLLQIEQGNTEENFVYHRQNENKAKKLMGLAAIGLICIALSYSLKNGFDIFDLFSFLIKSGGLLFSILLVAMELGFKMSVTEKLCSISTNNGCEKVTRSRMSSITQTIKLADLGLIYFTSVLLYQLTSNAYLLAEIALLCIPIIIISILYQTFILKVFCPLCLSVMLMLTLDIACYYFGNIYTGFLFSEITISGLLALGGIVGLISGGWFILKKLIQDKNSLENNQYSYYRLLRNPERIQNLVQCLPAENIGNSENEIIIGDKNADITITEVMNPYCSPCGDSLKKILYLLNIFETGLKFRILFISKKSDRERNNKIISHLLSFAKENSKEQVIEALLSWFQLTEYEKWAKKYPLRGSFISEKELEVYLNFRKEHKIEHTPTLFVNDKRMSIEESLMDLRYYMEDKLPQQ